MENEYRALVESLLDKTKRGEVLWKDASAFNFLQTSEEDPDDFAVSTTDATVNVYRLNVSAIGLNIHDENGRLVTRIAVQYSDSDYALCQELLSIVRKYVLGEDRILKKLLLDLGTKGKVIGAEDDVPF